MGEILPATAAGAVAPKGSVTSSLAHVTKIIPATYHVVVAGHHGGTSSNRHVVERHPVLGPKVVTNFTRAMSATVAASLLSVT